MIKVLVTINFIKLFLKNMDTSDDHLGTCQNISWNQYISSMWYTHKKLLCSKCALLFHWECNLKIKEELDFIKSFSVTTSELIENVAQFYADYNGLMNDHFSFKKDVDYLIECFGSWMGNIENPPPDLLNSKEKISCCIKFITQIKSSQVYIQNIY